MLRHASIAASSRLIDFVVAAEAVGTVLDVLAVDRAGPVEQEAEVGVLEAAADADDEERPGAEECADRLPGKWIHEDVGVGPQSQNHGLGFLPVAVELPVILAHDPVCRPAVEPGDRGGIAGVSSCARRLWRTRGPASGALGFDNPPSGLIPSRLQQVFCNAVVGIPRGVRPAGGRARAGENIRACGSCDRVPARPAEGSAGGWSLHRRRMGPCISKHWKAGRCCRRAGTP
jgi:hypothetical protein